MTGGRAIGNLVCGPASGAVRGGRLTWAAFVLLLAGAMPVSAAAQAGALDTSFGGDGKVTTNLTVGYDYAVDLVLQVDGKLVAAGPASGGGGRFALVRYTDEGSLDGTFSSDGKAFTNFTSGVDSAFDLILQPDGRLVAVGRAGGSGGRFALARYNVDGTLDVTFGRGGKVTTNFSRGDDSAFGVALQADGKIVAAGRAGGLGGRFAVARYHGDGRLDTTFSGDGKLTTNFTAGNDLVDHLALQANEKIVVAGTAGYNRSNARFALARYNPNGRLDTSFSGDGRLTTDFTAGFDGAFGLAIQPDQKIVAVGQARRSMGFARYRPNGTLDPLFSGDGKATANFTAGLDYADDVALSPDGKIVVAGAANFQSSRSRFALVRLNPGGALDTAFSADGKVTTDFTPGWDGAFAVEIEPAGGKIVAAGGAGNRGARFALARYLAE